MACLSQLGGVTAAYVVVAGGCDWPLPRAGGLSNNDVIALRALRFLRCVRCVLYAGWKACVNARFVPGLVILLRNSLLPVEPGLSQ